MIDSPIALFFIGNDSPITHRYFHSFSKRNSLSNRNFGLYHSWNLVPCQNIINGAITFHLHVLWVFWSISLYFDTVQCKWFLSVVSLSFSIHSIFLRTFGDHKDRGSPKRRIHTQFLDTSCGQQQTVGAHQSKLNLSFFHCHSPLRICSVALLVGSSNNKWSNSFRIHGFRVKISMWCLPIYRYH